MRKILCISVYVLLFLSGGAAQINFIPKVPDYSQPPDTSLLSTLDVTNYCAP
jgi:hypothetical protein